MDNFPGYGFEKVDSMFNVFFILFFIVFSIIIVIIVLSIVKGISQWNKNNNQPVLTVDATVVSKRMNVSHHHQGNGDNLSSTSSSTNYYITFQVASGDRMEFLVPDNEYGMIVEGDVGKITFQGTRYKGFVREH
ncbi:DUF2500 domain-containing protein [Clostridium sp. Marseille-P299]|uniref:DUF2500 domain-containing protein n=1 Tax=Clostridium sp. Marseille-P299 TaxID=1805477 RepID=UPI00082DA45F|nr:DUF2500 domain-containing protein [Clostridium sp. Marseille-P299]